MHLSGINRNIMECKGGYGRYNACSATTVLIETLWNVKYGRKPGKKDDADSINRNIMECKVILLCLLRSILHCINRNIMECKVTIFVSLMRYALGINRNIMECKVASSMDSGLLSFCINRNIMECKDNSQDLRSGPLAVLIETLWNVKFLLSITAGWSCPY